MPPSSRLSRLFSALYIDRQTRWRKGAILAASLALHAAVLIVLALPAIAPFVDRSNDEGAVIVTLESLARQDARDLAAAPSAAALRVRAPRAVQPSPVAPLLLPGGLAAPAARGGAPSSLHPAPLPEGPRGDLRAALRGSSVGCAHRDGVGLNRREREHCDETLGAGVRTARAFEAAPMDSAKRAAFDQAAQGQEAARRYREAPMGLGVDHRSRDGLGKAKDIPFVMGDTDGIGRQKSDASLGIKRR